MNKSIHVIYRHAYCNMKTTWELVQSGIHSSTPSGKGYCIHVCSDQEGKITVFQTDENIELNEDHEEDTELQRTVILSSYVISFIWAELYIYIGLVVSEQSCIVSLLILCISYNVIKELTITLKFNTLMLYLKNKIPQITIKCYNFDLSVI